MIHNALFKRLYIEEIIATHINTIYIPGCNIYIYNYTIIVYENKKKTNKPNKNRFTFVVDILYTIIVCI